MKLRISAATVCLHYCVTDIVLDPTEFNNNLRETLEKLRDDLYHKSKKIEEILRREIKIEISEQVKEEMEDLRKELQKSQELAQELAKEVDVLKQE